ncbi:TetR/AcrR family transcriptional regulator C-terminal domain-containing protein [Gordonia crocea]|uniref:TetR family transcriptional regulator n=1 Tax=Gordonia crocea TaxID=589162 RepID=A0A7I9UXT3_9ACTN|nr:TetR/AcrR family transcriptional regulator C-terminal domain-containing protein [Gordonia crocea]GED97631.1 TetR family transcriptional regulator [Gordonia crocea]
MGAKLTRESIVEAAFGLLDADGIEGLTVRALAARLGVKAPALYWHVDSKQALLDEMGTEIARRIATRAVPNSGEGFEAALRGYAVAAREEYLAHRDGARTFSGTRINDPAVLRGQEAGLRRWISQGVSLERIVDAYDVVTAFVVGFVIEEQERADGSRYSLAQRDDAVGEDYPLAVAAGHYGFRPAQQRFDEQLDLLIRCLSQRR